MNIDLSKNKVSILGAGFIGNNLISAALKKGFSVSVLSRHACPEKFQNKMVKWVQGDFNNPVVVTEAIKGADIVYHLISNSVPGDNVAVEDDLFENVSNTIQFLESCNVMQVNRVIFLSSSSVYGEQERVPINESATLAPISTHAIQKITLEHYLNYYKRLYNFDIKIIRLSNPYGPGQNIKGRQGFISIVLGNVMSGETTVINGGHDIIRDYIYIDDVTRVLLQMLDFSSDEIIFNLGSGKGESLLDVIKLISKILKQKIEYEIVSQRDAGISKSILDVEKIQKYLGYPSKVNLNDGIRKYLSYLGLLKR